MGEALGGSVDAMMRAAGYTNMQDFFKAVEAGKLKSKDVLPKFAEEMKKMAREGGALDAVMNKTRAQMGRFFNTLTEAKDTIFQGGMDEGLGYMFGSLADSLERLAPAAKAFGGIFKGVISLLTGALKLILAPLEVVVDAVSSLWSTLGGTDNMSKKVWAVIGAGGTLALLVTRFKVIQNVIGAVNVGLLAMLGNLARIAIPLLAIEDVYGSLQGKASMTGAGGSFSASNVLGSWASWMDKPISSYFSDTKVVVEVKGEEAAKFINATVSKQQQSQTAVNQSETAQ